MGGKGKAWRRRKKKGGIPGERKGSRAGSSPAVGVILRLQSRIMRVLLYGHSGEELIPHLKTRAIDTGGKRNLVRLQGARGKGAITIVWAT